MFTQSLLRLLMPLATLTVLSVAAQAEQPDTTLAPPSIVHKVQSPSERLEMTVHTSRILTLGQKIPQAQVNNPDILELTPLSPDQIQVSAKAPGVTQVNLWGEDKKLFTIDVVVYGDARELEMVLRATFPNAALKITPLAKSVLISGFVEQAEHIDRIVRVAEEYYPKVINNMTVGGCQQVLLHVKIMEVSRTKLRDFGFDWAYITGSNMLMSGVSGMVVPPYTPVLPSGVGSNVPPASSSSSNPITSTMAFNIADGSSAFFGVLDAMQQDNMAKILAEPTLVTVSGRPASFLAGGSFYIVPQGLAASAPINVPYGTKLDFVPIVLGNGRIHLDVRPKVSQIDPSLSVQGYPGLLERQAETGVELQAGQTLAIAGLVQSRVESENRGVPWISELPYVGAAFRRVHEKINEVELLILVTPELVEAMDADDVPPCGPGMQTTSPSDWELFMKGYLEVPKCCPAGNGECQQHGEDPNASPPDGMILGPGEKVPTPQPADAARRPSRNAPNAVAQHQPTDRSKSAGSYSRYNPSNPNSSQAVPSTGSPKGPPGLIGPVGYDVVK
jgi:pilus assembly protein CpaC